MATILSFSYSLDDPFSEPIRDPLDPNVTTLDRASNALPAGAYTTFRTYQKTHALTLAEHFQRLEHSAELAGHPVRLDAARLRNHIRAALKPFPDAEARVRLTIPFGLTPRRLYIFVSALTVPTAAQKANGVAVLTTRFQREQPQAKLSDFIQSSQGARERLKEGYEEILMVDEQGCFLEGLTSNFYAVMAGAIHTAGTGVLSGITRQHVLQLAEAAGYGVVLEAPKVTDIAHFDEAFITSASRGVLPVTAIDHLPVGSGHPGPVTRRLMQLYDDFVAGALEPI